MLKELLDQHVANKDGTCSCGWDVANYDLVHRGGGYFSDRPATRTEAWIEHVTKASYRAFPDREYAEVIGPDGDPVIFRVDHPVLHPSHDEWSVKHLREEYGPKPPREQHPDSVPMKHRSCEEVGCRDAFCHGGHFSFSIGFPADDCAGCHEPLGDEERVGVLLQSPKPQIITEGAALASSAMYHKRCEPNDEQIADRVKELWPEPEAEEEAPEAPRQAMACLSCGLAGETPDEFFPQPAGLWDRPCPECGEMTVWVTEPDLDRSSSGE